MYVYLGSGIMPGHNEDFQLLLNSNKSTVPTVGNNYESDAEWTT